MATSNRIPALHWALLVLMVAGLAALAMSGDVLRYGTAWPATVEAKVRCPLDPPPMMPGPHTPMSDRDLTAARQTQVAFIKSRMVLGAALLEPKVSELAFIKDMVEPVQWLEDNVEVEFLPNTDILCVRMKGRNPDDLTAIVNGVVFAYLTQVVDRENMHRRDRKARLSELLNSYELQLRTTRENQRNLMKQMNVGGQDKEIRAKTQGFLAARLAALEQQLLKSQVDRIQAEGRQRAAKAELAALAPAKLPLSLVTDALGQVPSVVTATAAREKLMLQRDEVKTRTANENDPALLRIEKEILTANLLVKTATDRERPDVESKLLTKARADLQQRITAEQSKAEEMKHVEELIEPDVKLLREQLARANERGMDLDLMQTDLTHLENMVHKLRAELERVNVELQAPKRVEVIEPATVRKPRGWFAR